MKLIQFICLWAAGALVLFKAANYILIRRRRSLRSRELGCKPVPKYSPGDPFGVQTLRSILDAAAKDQLPEHMVQRVEAVSAREGRLTTTFKETVLGQTNIFTCEPANIQTVLATRFREFEFGPGRNGNFGAMLGHGIFASDGKQWEHSRAMLRPQFARQQIVDLDLEEQHVQNLFAVLPPADATGWTNTVDLQVLLFRLTIDAATEFLFGESVGSQLSNRTGGGGGGGGGGTRDENKFTQAFDRAQYLLFRAGRYGDKYWLGHTAEFRRQVAVVHAFVDSYVDMALQQQQPRKTASDPEAAANGTSEKTETKKKQKYVFLDAIAAETRDREELRSQLVNILLAGRDTTASLLSWVFLTLSGRPDVFAKLRRAVLDDFGTCGDPRGEVTFESLKNCTYLQHVLKESLRLYTIVPVNQRRAAVDTSLPTGGGPDGRAPVFVAKGTEVTYSVHVMHKRKDLWGEDADEFRPERWEGRKPGWEYLPFNGGPRICIGQQFALTESSYIVVRMLQRFDALEAEDAGGVQGYRMTLTCAPSAGVKLRLREARE